jgi:plasmid replication initiation protein
MQKTTLQKGIYDNELVKHSATIHISNKLTLIERKIVNVLLKNAYNDLLSSSFFNIKLSSLTDQIGWHSYNTTDLKEAISNLVGTKVEWNIFKKDKKNSWTISTLISSANLEDRPGYCRYSYSEELKLLLSNPNIYARLDLMVQRKFSSKHALAIWEYLIEALCTSDHKETTTNWMTLEDYRRLLGIEDSKYPEFKKFNAWLIKAPLKEINEVSDINAKVEFEKINRRIVSIRFLTSRKKDFQPTLGLEEANNDNLDQDDKIESQEVLLNTLCKEFKLSRAVAEKHILKYGVEQIEANMEYVRVQNKKGKIGNLAAYTVTAIKDDLQLEKTLKESSVVEDDSHLWGKSKQPDLQEKFNEFLEIVKQAVGEDSFKSWFKINLVSLEVDKLLFDAKSTFIAETLIEKHGEVIKDAIYKTFQVKKCSMKDYRIAAERVGWKHIT